MCEAGCTNKEVCTTKMFHENSIKQLRMQLIVLCKLDFNMLVYPDFNRSAAVRGAAPKDQAAAKNFDGRPLIASSIVPALLRGREGMDLGEKVERN
jgi:hypothetical protein